MPKTAFVPDYVSFIYPLHAMISRPPGNGVSPQLASKGEGSPLIFVSPSTPFDFFDIILQPIHGFPLQLSTSINIQIFQLSVLALH